jgi:hypothetical protein
VTALGPPAFDLLDEGVVVYWPVEATPDPDGVLRRPATAPADEHG